MTKATWKKRGLSEKEIRAAERTSRRLNEAAKALGVDRTTLYRWLQDDPSLKAPIRERQEAAKQALELLSPDDWSTRIVELYELSETERVTLDLARQSLEIANDAQNTKASERLAAMRRFQQLVKDLNLEAPSYYAGKYLRRVQVNWLIRNCCTIAIAHRH